MAIFETCELRDYKNKYDALSQSVQWWKDYYLLLQKKTAQQQTDSITYETNITMLFNALSDAFQRVTSTTGPDQEKAKIDFKTAADGIVDVTNDFKKTETCKAVANNAVAIKHIIDSLANLDSINKRKIAGLETRITVDSNAFVTQTAKGCYDKGIKCYNSFKDTKRRVNYNIRCQDAQYAYDVLTEARKKGYDSIACDKVLSDLRVLTTSKNKITDIFIQNKLALSFFVRFCCHYLSFLIVYQKLHH